MDRFLIESPHELKDCVLVLQQIIYCTSFTNFSFQDLYNLVAVKYF